MPRSWKSQIADEVRAASMSKTKWPEDAMRHVAELQAEIARLTAALENAVAQERDTYATGKKVAVDLIAERDTARAETAMMVELAAKVFDLRGEDHDGKPVMERLISEAHRQKLLALTPAHATAALAARDQATREAALREAQPAPQVKALEATAEREMRGLWKLSNRSFEDFCARILSALSGEAQP